MAEIDLRLGNLASAWTQLGPALRLAHRASWGASLGTCLSLGGELCAALGRWEEATTLLAARGALRRARGEVARPAIKQLHAELLSQAARELGPERARAAEQRGAAMSLETAVEYLSLLLADASPGEAASQDAVPAAASAAMPQLSQRERELVTLVARGMTDAQIGGQLFISVSTVRSHLDRIRDKTGSRRRADLTRLALSAGLV